MISRVKLSPDPTTQALSQYRKIGPIQDRALLEAEMQTRANRKMEQFFPATGPLRRELYAKHLEFFRAGAQHKERAFIAGNRVGKTLTGCFEDAMHLTGLYPEWWEGRRFSCPTDGWVAGDTNRTTRDILQLELLGRWGGFGSGLIPKECILGWTSKGASVPAAVDTVRIRHASGGVSHLGFKSYAEGRANFQGTAKHFIHFDEEPSLEVWTEALMRTMIVPGDAGGGLAYLTFTPLLGWSDVVTQFLEGSV